jgi:hypothetical protein
LLRNAATHRGHEFPERHHGSANLFASQPPDFTLQHTGKIRHDNLRVYICKDAEASDPLSADLIINLEGVVWGTTLYRNFGRSWPGSLVPSRVLRLSKISGTL